MEPIFQRDQRVKQISTGRVGTIILYDEHPTTGTRFYHVQFDGETQYAAVAESDLQAA
jgi:hypothetical protein